MLAAALVVGAGATVPAVAASAAPHPPTAPHRKPPRHKPKHKPKPKPKPTIRLGTYAGTTSQREPVVLTVSRTGIAGLPCASLCLATPGSAPITTALRCGSAATDTATERVRVLPTRIPASGQVSYAFGDRDQPSTIALDTIALTVTVDGSISGTVRSHVAAGDGTACDSGAVRFTATLRP